MDRRFHFLSFFYWTRRVEDKNISNGRSGTTGDGIYIRGDIEEKEAQGRIDCTYEENPVGVGATWWEEEESGGY